MNNTMAITAAALLSVSFAASAGAMPAGSVKTSGNSLVLNISNSVDCADLKAERANLQDSRDAYNGNESNWALKDEIRVLDDQLYALDDQLVAAKCS